MFLNGGNGDSGPFKSLILLKKIQVYIIKWIRIEENLTTNIDANVDSYTYKSFNSTREAMAMGIGPPKPLAWINLR